MKRSKSGSGSGKKKPHLVLKRGADRSDLDEDKRDKRETSSKKKLTSIHDSSPPSSPTLAHGGLSVSPAPISSPTPAPSPSMGVVIKPAATAQLSRESTAPPVPHASPRPQYQRAEFAIAVSYEKVANWAVASPPNRLVASVTIPDTRPEGTSGEPEGGHLTPWVAIRSEIHQNVHNRLSIDTAIANVKKLVENYVLMPGHSRAGYLDQDLQEIYQRTKKELLTLHSQSMVHESHKAEYLGALIDAYLRARNALPLTAVATTDNKGHGEPIINDLLWSYEQTRTGFNAQQLSGLLWCLLDVEAADSWATAIDQEENNWQAMSPTREPTDYDENDPDTWEVYDRRMIEVFVQHIMGMRKAYVVAFQDAAMTSENGIARLLRWLDKPKVLKQESGVGKVTGNYWEGLKRLGWDAKGLTKKIAIVLAKAESEAYKETE
jgi:hypothetical protein